LVPLIGNLLGAGASVVSVFAPVLVAPLVIAVAWFWYRPMVSAIAIAAGVLLAVALRFVAGRRGAAARGSVPAHPGPAAA
jgi:hypothetical protein